MTISNQRMVISLGLSLLLHGLILFSLHPNLRPRGQASGSPLAVHLVPRPATHPEAADSAQTMLASTAISDSQVTADITPQPAQPIAAQQEQQPDTHNDPAESRSQTTEGTPAPPPAGSPTGIAFPTAISLPWAPGLQVRPVSHSGPPADHSRQMMEMQARQRQAMQTEQQAKTMLDNLTASVNQRLAEQGGSLAGTCTLDADAAASLACRPARLARLLEADADNLAAALRELRATGMQVTGLSIAVAGGHCSIAFREKIPDAKATP